MPFLRLMLLASILDEYAKNKKPYQCVAINVCECARKLSASCVSMYGWQKKQRFRPGGCGKRYPILLSRHFGLLQFCRRVHSELYEQWTLRAINTIVRSTKYA